ncbi:unnamed protein product [Darwinula stevensoni]|uniref:START domain-containing protein n=1 Tax=Darwinula stevensoni TaxID=69355 RepID=A0A7R9A7Q1_9CRUS|nr:unnamed protein product [Darwinula stevensoni]CAG0894395.1 unnamed protein product [Darwinula stevensoni]
MVPPPVGSMALTSLRFASLFLLHDPVFDGASAPSPFPGPADGLANSTVHPGNPDKTPSPSEDPYVEQGESAFREVKQLLEKDDWETVEEEDGIVVKKHYNDKYKRYDYLSETVLNASAEVIFNELWWHYERSPTWNAETTGVEIIKRISNDTMIARVISADQGSPYITRRDFLSVYSWHHVDDTFYICYVSTEFPGAPSNEEYTRGSHNPSCFVISPRADGFTAFRSVLNADAKVYAFLEPIFRVAMIRAMINYAAALREYAPKLEGLS